MEIKLDFNEKQFRDLYDRSYLPFLKELDDHTAEQRRVNFGLLIGIIATGFMAILHRDWMYYSLIFLLVSLVYTGWTEMKKRQICTNVVRHHFGQFRFQFK